MSKSVDTCELCCSPGGEVIWDSSLCRVVLVGDADYPGFCRVICNRHEPEMSDLSEAEQQQMMRVVFAVELVLRRLFKVDKINLACLGNMTPHIHWHIIPRWRDDRCFPNPIWAEPLREAMVEREHIDICRLNQELVTLLDKPITTSRECLS